MVRCRCSAAERGLSGFRLAMMKRGESCFGGSGSRVAIDTSTSGTVAGFATAESFLGVALGGDAGRGVDFFAVGAAFLSAFACRAC